MRPMKLSGEEIIFGKDSLQHLSDIKGHRAVIITSGTFLKDSGQMDRIQEYLSSANIESIVFDKVAPDPNFEAIQDGAIILNGFKPDVIVGVGGGSAIDAAKAMWVLYEHNEIDSIEKLAKLHNNLPKMRKKAIMVAIPTTSGTASEVSRSMVITNSKTHEKVGVSDMQLLADIAILDPSLTLTLPKKITAETGLDALTHGVESFLSQRANILSETFSLKAVELIIDNLFNAYEYGKNFEARENMQIGCMMAGIAFSNVSLGLAHGIAHTIGGEYGLSHGLLNGIVLPYIIKLASKSEYGKKRMKLLEHKLNITSLFDSVVNLNKKMNIPEGLDSMINEKDFFGNLDEIANNSLLDGCTKTSPYVPAMEEMKILLTQIYKGELMNEH